jgi:hypothetical protein
MCARPRLRRPRIRESKGSLDFVLVSRRHWASWAWHWANTGRPTVATSRNARHCTWRRSLQQPLTGPQSCPEFPYRHPNQTSTRLCKRAVSSERRPRRLPARVFKVPLSWRLTGRGCQTRGLVCQSADRDPQLHCCWLSTRLLPLAVP